MDNIIAFNSTIDTNAPIVQPKTLKTQAIEKLEKEIQGSKRSVLTRLFQQLTTLDEEDEPIWLGILKEDRSLEEAYRYIENCAKEVAQKERSVMVEDDTVYKWCDDYFTAETITNEMCFGGRVYKDPALDKVPDLKKKTSKKKTAKAKETKKEEPSQPVNTITPKKEEPKQSKEPLKESLEEPLKEPQQEDEQQQLFLDLFSF